MTSSMANIVFTLPQTSSLCEEEFNLTETSWQPSKGLPDGLSGILIERNFDILLKSL